jgi:mutator protein MutT
MLYAGIVIIFNKKGEILIVQRSPACDTYPEYWCLPGGGADKGETAEECAVREVREETNLKIKPDDLTYFYTITRETDQDIVFFIAEKYKGDVKLDWESMDSKWLPAFQLRNEHFIPTPDLLFDLIEMYAERYISKED